MSNTSSSVTITEIQVDPSDPTKTIWGDVLANNPYFAIVRGTSADETFDAADVSAPTLARMAAHKRGVTVAMNGGNDTVIGSPYGDTITAGAGVNYVDGGANQGIQGIYASGSAAQDMLDIYVADAAAAAAVAVIVLDPESGGVDGTAFAGGYKFKVTNGLLEMTYVKNIEQVNVRLESDRSFFKAFTIAVQVTEIRLPVDQLATKAYLAYATGSAAGDTFDAASDISAATLANMNAVGRGVYVDAGAGNDTVKGSAYGDYIIAGAGINYVDGGANGGSTTSVGTPEDVLQITVASAAAATAVQVVALAGSADAADISAAQAGYSHKVVAAGETDYIKGIERVSIHVFDGANWSFARDIALAVQVQSANLAAPNIGDYSVVAWVNGTANADAIDLASGSTLLSVPLAAQMVSGKQGVWIDGGGGNDIITGSAYADSIRNGDGNARIDGGGNDSAQGRGNKDSFEITVATRAEMEAIVVSPSTDPLYTWMVSYGAGISQKDYLRNIEGVYVFTPTGESKFIALSMDVHEASGPDIAGNMHMAWANGTTQADSFDAAADISAATRALMDSHGRGLYVDTGAGDDTIKGSGYGDDIYAGAGVNHVDGGANAGLRPSGGKAEDVLRLRVADQAAVDAVQLVVLGANTGSARDIVEFNNGYTHKVVSAGATNYIRNIERISIAGESGGAREILLAVSAQEANPTEPHFASFPQIAWVSGSAGADNINLADGSLLSVPLVSRMAAGKQGLYVDGGAGDDVIIGSGFSDVFQNGAGNSKIDGGAHAAANGRLGRDVFQVAVADQAALDAVQVAPSDNAAYSWVVTYGAGSTQKDYLKNIEGISVYIEGGGAGKWLALTIDVTELSDADVANSAHLARAYGTPGADTFDAASDVSTATLALMATHGRGVYVDSGAGADTLAGTAFGDHFLPGAGNDYVDGGLNGGPMSGGRGEDVLQLTVASAAAAAAVQVTELSDAGSAADNAAFGRGFTHKVVQPAAGGETDYIKGIERISIQVFDGANWSLGREILLDFDVAELAADADLARFRHFAWATGTAGADTFDPVTDIPAATRALMDTHQRGVVVDGGAGSDTITGSPYGDELMGGDGIDYIDGGAQSGMLPARSGLAEDVLRLNVGSLSDLAAAAVSGLDGGGSAADIAAFDKGYTHKLSVGSVVTDYFKNIEAIELSALDGAANLGNRRIALTVSVNEVDLAAPHENYSFLATATGTDVADVINMRAGTALLSAAIQAEMARTGRGVSIEGGKGNDVITGTAYADSFVNGSGNARIDGGANLANATFNSGDRFLIQVASQAELDAVVFSLSDDPAYSWMVAYGPGSSQKDYLRNVEDAVIFIMNGPSRLVQLGVEIKEHVTGGPTRTGHLVEVTGTSAADTFNAATDTSAAVRAAMAANSRGVRVEMGGGNDTVAGSPYGDDINGGAGTNHIDGGDNGGIAPYGPAVDTLTVTVASKAALDAVTIIALGSASTGADLAAFNNGYRLKVDSGAGEIDYIKNIEQVNVAYFNDINGNGQFDQGEYGSKAIRTAVGIVEYRADPARPGYLVSGGKITDAKVFAEITGTTVGDRFDAATGLSAATLALMAANARGISADAGDGNDTVTGSDYEDFFTLGAGVNRVDGGTQLGKALWNGSARDTLTVAARSKADFDSLSVTKLSAASTGADRAAFDEGYAFKLANGAAETDYIRNVEFVSAYYWNDVNRNGNIDAGENTYKEINLAVAIVEQHADPAKPGYLLSGSPISSMPLLATANGTAFDDTFDAAIDLSPAVRALMDSAQLGVSIMSWAGDDVIKASPYPDWITAGSGTNYIDGGANTGFWEFDALQVYVTDREAALALQLQPLSAASSGADAAAFAAGYLYKLDAGNEIDYIVNVEHVRVYLWNDKNGDGKVTQTVETDPLNEATFVITLVGVPI